MTIRQPKQRPVRLLDQGKRDVRTQFGALCWRSKGDGIEVLLITSRRSKRWIIPKGWPEDGATPAEAAMTESWEEAGVVGKAQPLCLGIYSYAKGLSEISALPCVVAVFPVRVAKLKTDYPEVKQRRRKWFSRKKAAKLVDEPELATMIRQFDPAGL
ncbi:MAG: NUDIX hydrolase [Silicimonas sp.]|jgi:8-oxo-dGTP pyrophosphatase MutT (NUDIX family)|nr:NUDIX hydrolase [Silicimonas sp.]